MKPILAALAALVAVLAYAAPALAAPSQESTFQDDNLLVYSDPPKVAATLDELKALGVDRIRVTLVWRAIAPGNEQDLKPSFDATDPEQYDKGAWDRWDTVARLAAERGIAVNFNPTVPAPDWATGTPARADIDPTYDPSAEEFGNFVKAAATRYDGSHGVPRVDYWTIQNEPNQAGWLTPQWQERDGQWVEASPRIYRAMVDAAWSALQATGHGSDTILIGETAPKGLRTNRGETRSIDALRFIRRLYCVDDNLQVLAGAAADAQGCPASDQLAAFPAAHPALFRSTGYAHHPYELLFAPNHRPSWPDWATMANLEDLQSLLRRVYDRYAQPHGATIPLYLTEFGYQTNPPDRAGVAPGNQAKFLNQAEYLAYRQRDVRTLAQFLMVDGGEPVTLTFQSGLRRVDGSRKPAWSAYRFPVWVPRVSLRRGQPLRIWGLPRPAPNGSRPRVDVQFRRSGSKLWRRVAVLTGDAGEGYVNGALRAPGTGSVRLAWNGLVSRSTAIRVAKRRGAARR